MCLKQGNKLLKHVHDELKMWRWNSKSWDQIVHLWQYTVNIGYVMSGAISGKFCSKCILIKKSVEPFSNDNTNINLFFRGNQINIRMSFEGSWHRRLRINGLMPVKSVTSPIQKYIWRVYFQNPINGTKKNPLLATPPRGVLTYCYY